MTTKATCQHEHTIEISTVSDIAEGHTVFICNDCRERVLGPPPGYPLQPLLRWTTEKPTKPGWYFYSECPSCEPVMVQVSSGGGGWICDTMTEEMSEQDPNIMPGRWAGPIAPPEG